MRFQGLFHSSVRGAFHLSLTVLVRYRSLAVFSLSGWSPIIRPGFLVSRVTQVPASRLPPISPTGLSPSLAGRSRPSGYRQQPRQRRSYNPGQGPKTPPVWAPPRSLAATGGIILIFFSSGYLDVSVPRVGPPPMRRAALFARRVPPFGHLRIKAHVPLPGAFRSLSRPSSPARAKASPACPPSLSFFLPPAALHSGPLVQGNGAAAPPGARSLLFKLLPSCQ